MLKVEDIRNLFREKLKNEDFVIDKSGVKMLEVIGQSFVVDEPQIFGSINLDYAEREKTWYLSQSLNVNDIPGNTPKIWTQVSDPDGLINSNYGYLVFSDKNHDQYYRVYQELLSFPFSRRAIMIYTRPEIHYEYNKNGMSDFICTNTVQYLIRDDKLHAIVSMRSNDVRFGFLNDFHWQTYVRDRLASDLEIDVGDIIWCAGSLHIYERDFGLVI